MKKARRNVTTSDGSWATFTFYEAWDGWLIAGNTHDTFVMQNKLILHGYIHFKTILRLFKIFPHIFPTQQNNFCSYWKIFQIIPYPTSRSNVCAVNLCNHKFACTNATPKRRNGSPFYNSCDSLRMSNKPMQRHFYRPVYF